MTNEEIEKKVRAIARALNGSILDDVEYPLILKIKNSGLCAIRVGNFSIYAATQARNIPTTRQNWLLEAILEKLEREANS